MQVNGVQPYTVKNNNYNTSFQARFGQGDIEFILDTVKQSPMSRELMPRVYTMLKFIDLEVPGRLAKIHERVENSSLIHKSTKYYSTSISVDDVYEPSGIHTDTFSSSHAIIDALENMCIFNRKNNPPKNYVRMPQIIFDQAVWKNRRATETSIRNLAYGKHVTQI